MKAGPIVRGVTFAENCQRLAEADGDLCPDNQPVDFPCRWAIFTYVRTSHLQTGPRHEAAMRADQAVKLPARVAAGKCNGKNQTLFRGVGTEEQRRGKSG